MATIFYKAGGNFSALTPQKTVFAQVASTCVGVTYWAYDVLTAGINIAFTPSEAGDVEGIYAEFRLATLSATQTVTVTLQESVLGVWTDRASKSLTYNAMVGAWSATLNGKAVNSVWCYFEFAAPYAVDAVAGKWRIRYLSSNNQANLCRATGGNVCAVVITAATAYGANDTILLNTAITVVVDQSITSALLVIGNDARLNWAAAPGGAYTLDVVNLYMGTDAQLNVGSSANRVPYAQQATLSVTTFQAPLVWGGDAPWAITVYGELPTAIRTTLAQNATAGQKNLVTTDDMSATWQAGDTIIVNCANAAQTKVIDSIAGTTVTCTTNLSLAEAGYSVINQTRWQKCGVKLGRNMGVGSTTGNLYRCLISGMYQATYNVSLAFFYGTFDTFLTTSSLALVEPLLVEYLTGEGQCAISMPTSVSGNGLGMARHSGSIIRHRYAYQAGGTGTNQFSLTSLVAYAISHIYCGGYVNAFTANTVGGAFSNCEVILNSWAGYVWPYFSMYLQGANNTYTDIRTNNANCAVAGTNQSFTRLSVDNVTTIAGLIFVATTVNAEFTDCAFGQKKVNGSSLGALTGTYVTAMFRNCLFDAAVASASAYTALSVGSLLRLATANQIANNHLTYAPTGITQSVGDGLPDTTVHTAGAGKFALRFEPQSSTNRLEWTHDAPTGNIQGLTMTVAVWCKINAAAYYAGVHQLPRLTVNYDDGTLAFAQALANTGWQLLSVVFTPATAFGQITITMSGMTDAVGANAYVYWDDGLMLYPASYVLNMGGMDLFADALPVTPLIATVFSAQDVWTAQTITMNGLGTIGKLLVDNVDTPVSTRAEAATALSTADWTALRAAALDNLDALITSRLASGAYTAPDNAGILAAIATAQADLDNPDQYKADVSGLATVLERLTALRAGYLDKLNVSGTLAHSDNANAYKADVSGLATPGAEMALTGAAIDAIIADVVTALTANGKTPAQALRLILAALLGVSSGMADGAPTFADIEGNPAIEGVLDDDGNRTEVTLHE